MMRVQHKDDRADGQPRIDQTVSQSAAWRALWQRLLSKNRGEQSQQPQTAITTESDLIEYHNQQSDGRGNES